MDIRTYRTHKGLTQTRLAEMVGCSQATISAIENGTERCGWELAAKIHEITGGAVSKHETRPDIFGPSGQAA